MINIDELIKRLEIEYQCQWKRIQGHPKHLVSNMGDIYSLKYKKLLKPVPLGIPQYFYVCLDRKWERVNRLVGISFVPNPLNKPVCNHIDGDKFNNSADNLNWMTYSENWHHAYNMGLITITAIKCIAIDPNGIQYECTSMKQASAISGMAISAISRRLKGQVKKPRNGWSFILPKDSE